nr:hypothetical protein [Tanacetum cinerariifolium]
MLQICPNLPGHKFVDPPFKEEILAFIIKLGYSRDIKSLSDVKVDTLHQPWRTFRTIINKCLSGKEDLVYQIKNKVSKKNKDMYYPRFTKVIINHFMSKYQSIPRRNKVDWHMAKDDPILTTMRFIPKYENIQKYGVVLTDTLTNQAMKESDAYKTYYDFATAKVIPKPKYMRRSTREKTDQALKASPGKRIKATAKVAQSGKKKLHAQGLETLSEIALFKAGQMKLITKRSKTQFHSSHASGSGANEGTCSSDEDNDDEVSMSKDNDDNADNEDDDDEQTESDNDGDNFVHLKFSTHDEEVRKDEEDKEEECSDMRVDTPSYFESTDNEAYDEVTQEDNVEEEKMDKEKTFKEEKVNKMYNDININLEGRDTEMTEALLANVQATQVIEDTYVIITTVTPEVQHQSFYVSSGFISKILNPNPDTDRLRDEAKAENEHFINKTDENIKKIIKEEVKVQVKEQVSKILPRIEKLVNEQLEAEVLIRSSNEPKTSYAIAANLSELELKKILIDKMENKKSIDRSEFETGFTEDHYVDETSQLPEDFSAFVLNRLKVNTVTPELLAGLTFELMKGSCKSLVELEYFLEEVYKATTNQLDWNNPEGQQYLHDLRKPLPLIPNLRGRRVIPFDHFINNDLAYLSGNVSSRIYTTSVTKTKAADYGRIKWIEDLVPNTMWINRESARDVYSRHRTITITKLTIVEWHNYKHLDSITVRRDDDKLYTFKEGDYKRLHLQDIEDMLLLLVQDKLKNLTTKERLALSVSLRMFTRSIVIKGIDDTLNDVQSALDDILKRIRIEYLPQTVWRNGSFDDRLKLEFTNQANYATRLSGELGPSSLLPSVLLVVLSVVVVVVAVAVAIAGIIVVVGVVSLVLFPSPFIIFISSRSLSLDRLLHQFSCQINRLMQSCGSGRMAGQYSVVINNLNSTQGMRLALTSPRVCTFPFHQPFVSSFLEA